MTYQLTQEEAVGILYSWLYEYGLPGVNMNAPGNSPGEIVDRWLAEELRQAKEQAWGEGFDAGEQDVHQHKTLNEPCIPNPYRSQP